MGIQHAPALSDLFAPVGARDRWVLGRFLRKVAEVQSSRFIQQRPGLRATAINGATYLGGPAWSLSLDGPDQEAVKAVAGDFRQLWSDRESTSAASVIQILKAHAAARGSDGSRVIITQLEALEERLSDRNERDPRAAVLEEGRGQRPPREIIRAWLYGEYLHGDYEKAVDVGDGDPGAVPAIMQFSLQTAIHDFLDMWMYLGRLVQAVVDDEQLSRTR